MAKFVNILGKITGKITSKINRAFGLRGKPPKPAPTSRVIGHRGIAAGDLKERQRRAAEFYRTGRPEDQPYTAEEIAKWRQLSGDEVEDFVENEQPVFVNSSNVVMVQYFPVVQKLLVEFKKGASYLYSSVSKVEALSFAQAQSKGGWVWDNLRVRGSKTAHRKPYTRVGKM